MVEIKTSNISQINFNQDRPCSSYDSDCHTMTFEQKLSCFTDANGILKGGPADGFCPVLSG